MVSKWISVFVWESRKRLIMVVYMNTEKKEIEAKSVIELIDFFDKQSDKPLFLNQVYLNICFFGEDNPNTNQNEEYNYELITYSLEEDHNTEAWGSKFGPMHHIPQGDGTYMDRPTQSDITPHLVNYWETRVNQVTNPVLKLQYMGLLYSFKKKITNVDVDRSFLNEYAKTLLEASKGEHELVATSLSKHLPVAFEIAKNSKLLQLLQDIKKEYKRIATAAKDEHIFEWASYFELMINNLKSFNDIEQNDIVKDIEKRLYNYTSLTNYSPYNVKYIASNLGKYYKSKNDNVNKERVIGEIEKAFRKYIPTGVPLQRSIWLQEIQSCYDEFGIKGKADSVYSEIQDIGKTIANSLPEHEFMYEVPEKLIDEIKRNIIKRSDEETISEFVRFFTPKHQDAVNFVKNRANNPIAEICGTQLFSENGIPLSKVGTPKSDPEGNEFIFCARFINAQNIVMRSVLKELIEKNKFTERTFVTAIMKSGLIEEERRFIIEEGIKYYQKGETVLVCHLLIPQIEHAISNIAIKKGGQAMRRQRSGNGYMIQLMDKLFDDQVVKDILGEDAVFYLRTLLTEQRGMNLRNLLCHGLINPKNFDINVADRIIHTLLLIGNVII